MIADHDLGHLRTAITASRQAREKGNGPCGAVLVSAQGHVLLTGENTEVQDKDCTAHAETNLVRQASRRFDRDALREATIYASGEPCPMCAGAIYNSSIGRLVFALGQPRMYEIAGGTGGLHLRASEVLAHGAPRVTVEGPALEDEAAEVLLGR
jgi:tRNA(adenine34) deaminase